MHRPYLDYGWRAWNRHGAKNSGHCVSVQIKYLLEPRPQPPVEGHGMVATYIRRRSNKVQTYGFFVTGGGRVVIAETNEVHGRVCLLLWCWFNLLRSRPSLLQSRPRLMGI